MKQFEWYQLSDTSNVITPSLLVYPVRIAHNIELMIKMAGGVEFLRPHIKTHKMAEIIQMQMAYGIQKFKCATIAEAELLGQCGAQDILLAMQPVGANLKRYFQLIEKYPDSFFSTLVDNQKTLDSFIDFAKKTDLKVSLWLDINNGMDRTGIRVGNDALLLYKDMYSSKHINAKGLHIYDGHIHNEPIEEREKYCNDAFQPVSDFKNKMEDSNLGEIEMVVGGSPSFPIHSKRSKIECSPGTTLLWDERYGSSFKESEFLTSAVLITRIISKPKENLLCFDLGHKSIAPEMGFPRMKIFGLERCEQIGQSEEHLVVKCDDASTYEVGDVFYAIPMHICPTVAKYNEVLTITNNNIDGSWLVAARNQKITI